MNQAEHTRRIAVIGGGISGLAAAHRITTLASRLGAPVSPLLLEADSRLGGSLNTVRQDGFLLECGADSFISEKPEALSLAKEIGLESHIIGTSQAHRRSFIVRDGKLVPVPEGFQLLAPSRIWPFVTSAILSWRGKARLALDLVIPRSKTNGVDDESLAAFVRRRFGREALERIAQPMVGGIYTADPESLSLRATMPRFIQMEADHRSLIMAMRQRRRKQSGEPENGTSGARYGLFLSFDGGMKTLPECLAELLPPESVRLNCKVSALSFDSTGNVWVLETTDGQTLRADAVCVALAAPGAAALMGGLDAEASRELAQIPYASTAVVNLGYRREDVPHALDGFGFVAPALERMRTLACTFSSVKFAARAPDGMVLLRGFFGGALQPETFELSSEELIASFRDDLRRLLGISSSPLFTRVQKWPLSMPQYHLGHLERVKRIKERLALFPTLRLAGNAYEGVGVPDCIRSGELAAHQLIKSLAEISSNVDYV